MSNRRPSEQLYSAIVSGPVHDEGHGLIDKPRAVVAVARATSVRPPSIEGGAGGRTSDGVPDGSNGRLTLQQRGVLVTIYIAYMAAIGSSSSFEVAFPAAISDANLNVTAADFAATLAGGQVGTVVGKLAAGFVVDSRGASRVFVEALAVMSALVVCEVQLISWGDKIGTILAFSIYKAVKAVVFPAMAKATKGLFPSASFSRVWGCLVTSSRVGAVAGTLALSPLSTVGWYWPPLTAAASLAVTSAALCLQLRGVAAAAAAVAARSPRAASQEPSRAHASSSLWRALCVYGHDVQLWLIVCSEAMLLTVMDSSALVPLFLANQVGLRVDHAGQLSSLFPIGMVVSVVLSGFAFEFLDPTRTRPLVSANGPVAHNASSSIRRCLKLTLPYIGRAIFFSVMGLIGIFACLALATAGPGGSSAATGVGLFLIGASFSPAKYLPPTLYVLETVEDGHSGKMLALIDLPAYLLSASFYGWYPGLVATHGWGAVWSLLGVFLGVSTICITVQQLLHARHRLAAGVNHN